MALEPSRVLLVDDEPGVLGMLRTALRRYGFETEEAGDGLAALDLVRKQRFDVIVSDINMPNCAGLEFLRGVRELDMDVPVIMMTAKPSIDSSVKAVEYGAFRYLVKPVLPADLKEVIDRAVRLHEIARAKRKALELHGIDDKWLGDRALLEGKFTSALEQLWMAFQPVVSWRDRRVYGYEALVRSNEPALSNPGLLLEAAERLDKLHELGRRIRGRAVEVEPPNEVKLFVNLHPADLLDPELYLAGAPLTRIAKRVVLEMTERASLDTVRDLSSRITELKRMGFQIAIDDLGAGYAGLSAFTQLEPHIVKLDMSLVRHVDIDPKRRNIVKRLLEMCNDLAMEVVAEGVETTGERDALVGMGCDKLQGYLFARPANPFPTVIWGLRGPASAN
jgi:EAL domain-containing protein (putative c-di-GMP-specific phosphodiesterase class I)